MRLLMDKSSILGAFLHLNDEEFGEEVKLKGKTYHIPSVEVCMERFQQSFNKTIRDYDLRSMDVIVVCDPIKKRSFETARTRIFPEYKKHKPEVPAEFHKARKKLFEAANIWLKEQGCIIATPHPQVEADDLINELAIRLDNIVIWTRDKDMLASPANVLLQGRNGIEANPSKFPVPDKYIPMYRALVTGDASDGLKSCKGFGPKAWEGMIEAFGEDAIELMDALFREKRLHELEEDVGDFPKLQLIVDQADELYPVYECMLFQPVPAHRVKWEGGMQTGTSTLVTRKNYTEIFNHLQFLDFDYSVIDYETDVPPESLEWLKNTGDSDKQRIKIDVMASEICGMGLRINNENFYFSVDHRDTNNISLGDLEAVLELLIEKRIIAHNSTVFEQPVTYNHYEAMLPNMLDTSILASYVDENDYTNLKHLSKKNLGYKQATYQETLDAVGASGMREVSGEEIKKYGLDDVMTNDALYNLFKVITQYENTWEVFKKVEIPASYFTALCFINGVNFDAAKHQELRGINNKNIREAWESLNKEMLELGWPGGIFVPVQSKNAVTFNKVYKAVHGKPSKYTAVKTAIVEMPDDVVCQAFATGNLEVINQLYEDNWEPEAEFNVRSSPQMQKLLYSEEFLNLKVRIRKAPTEKMQKEGRKGNPSADETAISNGIAFGDAEGREGLLRALLDYKGYLTKESLFFSKYSNYLHWRTGKIHSGIRQSATNTRRFSSSKPNLQQLPKRQGKEVRNMITVPGPDWVMVSFDWSGQELRVAAEDSQDPAFVSCYIGDNLKDLHSLTGLGIAHKQGRTELTYERFIELLEAGDTEIEEFRTIGKKINFTCQYGAMSIKVGQTLGITKEEAQQYIDARAEAFPVLIKRVKGWHKECREKKYATTFLGARRHLHEFQYYGSREDHKLQAADRLAYSMRIQGSSAEMTKLSVGQMYTDGLFDDGLVIPGFTVHDEANLFIHISVLEDRMKKIHKCMTQIYAGMEISMVTEPETGTSFGSLQSYKMQYSEICG